MVTKLPHPETRASLLKLQPFGVRGAVLEGGVVQIAASFGLQLWPVFDKSSSQIATVYGLVLKENLGFGLSIKRNSIYFSGIVNSIEEFERNVVYGLNGCLIIETIKPSLGKRIYPDCGATLPIVFCKELKKFGSSASCVFSENEYRNRFLQDRFYSLIESEGIYGWIPGTLTVHNGLEFLLANHYLDLETFTQHRFWPPPLWLQMPALDIEDSAQIIATNLAKFSNAASKQFRISVALTAGMDSRLILSSCREFSHRISAFTMMVSMLSPDVAIAKKLSDMMNISHQKLGISYSTKEEMEIWDRMVGHCVREVNRYTYSSLLQIESDALLSGVGGESGRCFLYGVDWQIINKKPITVDSIALRLRKSKYSYIINDIKKWIDPIKNYPNSTILDLAFLELRTGKWAMSQNSAQYAVRPVFLPFEQWSIQESFIRSDIGDRGSGRLMRRVGEILWNEGMKIPINHFGDLRDYLIPIRKFRKLADPKAMRRYIQRRFAGRH